MVQRQPGPTGLNVQGMTVTSPPITQPRIEIPANSYITAGEPSLDSYTVIPTPGRRYTIKMKSTNRAIVLVRGELCLQQIKLEDRDGSRWLCCESGVFMAFYNEESGVYLGHDSKGSMRATARELNDWECLIAKHHREGGYELLSPHWVSRKRIVCASANKTKLVRVEHGHTLWVFKDCED